jgi:hypothetical protein
MTIRITFNGKEYPSVEDMPEEVRQAYHQALAQLADANQIGAADRNVIAIRSSSITVSGQTYGDVGDLPEEVRRLYEQAMASVTQDPNSGPAELRALISGQEGPPGSAGTDRPDLLQAEDESALVPPYGRRRMVTELGQFERGLETFLRVLLKIVAVAIVAGAAFIMWAMDAASRHQGGRLYVALGALVVLWAVESQFARLMRRREGLIDTEREPWRYSISSVLLLLVSAVVLFGLALLLP